MDDETLATFDTPTGPVVLRHARAGDVLGIVAMLHDVLICIGIYALLGREVTSSTVAAILTVLGYSIYDTIIIFDRVRENIPIMRRSAMATIVNVSLWETILLEACGLSKLPWLGNST